jgi:hypothetical protein
VKEENVNARNVFLEELIIKEGKSSEEVEQKRRIKIPESLSRACLCSSLVTFANFINLTNASTCIC